VAKEIPKINLEAWDWTQGRGETIDKTSLLVGCKGEEGGKGGTQEDPAH